MEHTPQPSIIKRFFKQIERVIDLFILISKGLLALLGAGIVIVTIAVVIDDSESSKEVAVQPEVKEVVQPEVKEVVQPEVVETPRSSVDIFLSLSYTEKEAVKSVCKHIIDDRAPAYEYLKSLSDMAWQTVQVVKDTLLETYSYSDAIQQQPYPRYVSEAKERTTVQADYQKETINLLTNCVNQEIEKNY